ncbi:MAG: hypothetical protein ACW99Q_22495, partial [Candidatus Kariarchaeaceae archaeon]
DTIIVTVIDLTPPNLSSPLDIQYDEGTTGNKIIWNVNDNYPDIMTVYRNGTIIFSTSWTSGNIEYFIDFLSIGVYNFTIVVVDKSANSASDTVLVTVIDNASPTLTAPADVIYSEGATGNSIEWTGTDLHAGTYLIYQNGSQVASNGWTSGIPISYDIDGLLKDIYNYTIVIIDTSGNQDIDTVIISVIDATDPIINTPLDIQYSEDSTGNTIPWIVSDNYSGTYIIYMNDSQVQNGTWISGVSIDYNIDGLYKENYNLTIIAFDTSNNYIVDTVLVIVVDTTNPSYVITPSDVQYIEGASGNSLVWNTTDKYPGNYIIYLDGSQIDTGGWLNINDISISIDGLVKGNYNYTIVVSDSSNNMAIQTTFVTVIEITPPQITFTSGNQTIIEGSIGNTINWTASDNYANMYYVYSQGSIYSSDIWTDNILEIVSIDGLDIGIYNFTVLIVDESSNSVKFTVFVTVIDTSSPVIINDTGSLEMIVGTSDNTLLWSASDKNAGAYEIYRDGAILSTSTWISQTEISIDLDGLSIGEYNFTIVFYDTSNNSVQSISLVSVKFIKTSLPQISYSPVVYEGYTDVITGTWADKDNNLIPSGSISGNLNTSQLESSTIVDGMFFLAVDYTSLDSGNYTLVLRFEQLSYENQTILLQVVVLKHLLHVDVTFDNQLIPSEEFTISIRITYADPEITNNLELNELGGKSGVYQGAEISTQIILEYENGLSDELIMNGESDSNGYFYITLSGEQTADISAIRSISVDLASGINTEAQSINFNAEEIAQFVSIGTPSNGSSDGQDMIVDPLILIGIIAALGLLVIFLFMSRRTKEKYDKIQTTKKDILLRLSEMYSIRSILIMNQQDASPLMEYVFKNDRVIENAV